MGVYNNAIYKIIIKILGVEKKIECEVTYDIGV
jgi:hypothetical protein